MMQVSKPCHPDKAQLSRGGGLLAVLVALLVAIAAVPAWAADSGSEDMYRLYNPNSGEHFYTAAAAERDSLVKAGWNYEGIGWVAPVKSDVPVYRLYSGTDHHYTTSAEERDSLVRVGWKYEGIGWYSAESTQSHPLYRQFNPNVNPSAKRNNSGSHNYTTSKAENDSLVRAGWKAEGIGWYALGEGRAVQASSSSTSNSGSSSSGTASNSSKSSSSSTSSSSSQQQSDIVYYTTYGKRYHQSRTCPAIINRRNVSSCTVAEAQTRGLTPCHDCY